MIPPKGLSHDPYRKLWGQTERERDRERRGNRNRQGGSDRHAECKSCEEEILQRCDRDQVCRGETTAQKQTGSEECCRVTETRQSKQPAQCCKYSMCTQRVPLSRALIIYYSWGHIKSLLIRLNERKINNYAAKGFMILSAELFKIYTNKINTGSVSISDKLINHRTTKGKKQRL